MPMYLLAHFIFILFARLGTCSVTSILFWLWSEGNISLSLRFSYLSILTFPSHEK